MTAAITSQRLYAWLIAGILGGALLLSLATRNLSHLLWFAGLFLVGAVALASTTTVLAMLKGKRPWNVWTPVHIVVVFSLAAFLAVGLVSVAERILWFNSSTPPSFLVAKDYGDRYTANKHRLFRILCDVRDAKGPLLIREIDNQVYVRCGDWFPQSYTISASKTAFDLAFAETASDKPGMSVIVDPDF